MGNGEDFLSTAPDAATTTLTQHDHRIRHQQSHQDGQSPSGWHSPAMSQGYEIRLLSGSIGVAWDLRLELRSIGADRLLEHGVVIPQPVPPHRDPASSR